MFPGALRELLTVVQAGSIRKASDLLGVAPSSVSRKIAIIENQFGTALFERTAGGAVLTPSGIIFAEYARSVVADYESLRADLNDLRGTRRRVIRLTVVESVVSGGLVEAASLFRERFDTLSFRINVLPATQVMDTFKYGDCDIAITFCGQPDADFTTIARIPEPIVLVVPINHPLAAHSSVSLDQLVDMPLALPDALFGVRNIFNRVWQDTLPDVEPLIALTSNSFESLRDLVRCGGLSILPMRAVIREQRLGQMKAVLIDHSAFQTSTLDIMVSSKNRLPKVISQFLEELVSVLSSQLTS